MRLEVGQHLLASDLPIPANVELLDDEMHGDVLAIPASREPRK